MFTITCLLSTDRLVCLGKIGRHRAGKYHAEIVPP
jgi:hypothetical protein